MKDTTWPFKEKIELHESGEELVIGSGWESVVVKLSNGEWVVKKQLQKNPNGTNLKESRRIRIENYLRYKLLLRDEDALKKIFGKEIFYPHFPVKLRDYEDKETIYLLQRRVLGETLKVIRDKHNWSNLETAREFRSQILDLTWGSKKAFITLGSPVDLHFGNLIFNEENKKIVFVDAGSPSYDREEVLSKSKNAFPIFKGSIKRISRLVGLEKLLLVTKAEKENLNKKYGIQELEFEKSVFLYLFECRALLNL